MCLYSLLLGLSLSNILIVLCTINGGGDAFFLMTAGKVSGRALYLLDGVMCLSLNRFLWPKDRMLLLTRSESHGDLGVQGEREEGIIYGHTTWTEAKREVILQKKIIQHRKKVTAITCANLINLL